MTSETVDTEISLAFCLLHCSTYLQVVGKTTAILVDDRSDGLQVRQILRQQEQLSKVC
jgi:hypothetical protein